MTAASIWTNPLDLQWWLRHTSGVVLTSGGFDPIHHGHARCLLGCQPLGPVVVVAVMADAWLLRKKGRVVLPLAERMEMVAAVRGVTHVVSWDDGTPSVDGLIRLLRPSVFAKGGDRSTPSQIAPAEIAACREVGCALALGVGGAEKVQSSSWIAARLGCMTPRQNGQGS